MTSSLAPHVPAFCPNPACHFHHRPNAFWRFHRAGYFFRLQAPHVIQRFRCVHCGRNFSTQTFSVTYWLKRPQLLPLVFHQLLACSGFRQIARHHHVAPHTILTHAARLGRHCLLFHLRLKPPNLPEPVVLDGFQSFEFSQFYPTWFHVVVGANSHFFYGFTDSELRRSGRMTLRQRLRRSWLERHFGRPHTRSIEQEVEHLFRLLAPSPQTVELDSDDHADYPRACRRLTHLNFNHHVTPSTAPRTTRNPLFPVNLLDLLLRHCGANHKRETIAFSKRRQSAVDRLWGFLVWRNYMKSFSENKRDATPAMRLGLVSRALRFRDVFVQRLFPSHFQLQERWHCYYRRAVPTRRIPNAVTHRLRYGF